MLIRVEAFLVSQATARHYLAGHQPGDLGEVRLQVVAGPRFEPATSDYRGTLGCVF